MEWNDWEPLYREIVAELGLDPGRDMESAMLLRHLTGHLPDCTADIDALVRGKAVVIRGPSPDRRQAPEGCTVMSAGSATEQVMGMGVIPDIVVTDLDGDAGCQMEASEFGAITVVHAHGDNIDGVRELVPQFRGPLLCTTQARPFPGMCNFGGFTDGDRAVFLAVHFHAAAIILRGFDLDNPVPKAGSEPSRKAAKLRIARRLIDVARKSAPAGTVWEM